MFTCDQVMAELALYMDDESAAGLRRQLEGHLAQCRTCTALYDSTRKTLKIFTESQSFDLPESLSDRIVRKIMAAVDPRPMA